MFIGYSSRGINNDYNPYFHSKDQGGYPFRDYYNDYDCGDLGSDAHECEFNWGKAEFAAVNKDGDYVNCVVVWSGYYEVGIVHADTLNYT